MMEQKEKIQVAIADDHHLIRHGLGLLLNSMEPFAVTVEAANGKELLDRLSRAETLPALALVDISMPLMDGFETIRSMARQFPSVRCIALSVHADFSSVFRMIQSGAKAYLLKDCSPEQMKDTLLNVLEQGFYYNSFVVESLMEYQQEKDRGLGVADQPLQELTDRETEFIRHCCSELAYKEIASLMQVSPRTVDGYRESIFSKLDLKTRVGIVLFAIRNGLYSPGGEK